MFAKNMQTVILLDIYGNLLTENQHHVLSDYYENDLSLGEIAAETGITRQAVSETVKRGVEILNKYENTLHVARKYNKIKEKLSYIENIAEQNKDNKLLELVNECKEII